MLLGGSAHDLLDRESIPCNETREDVVASYHPTCTRYKQLEKG